MNISYFSSLERLETRIAPAGMVAVTFASGLLTITGVDGADHDVEIVKTWDEHLSGRGQRDWD